MKARGVFISGDLLEKNAKHRRKVLNDTDQLGVVTKAVYSPRLESNIGFALLDVAKVNQGDAFKVESAEGMRDITITSLPFVDPDKKIPRASLRQG